ncbi:hypothetical protein DL96DRAFT_1617252 [Flagelloscypha sp. PMI_526]|nr:hypothetical protein DL96DRAFT_1617252 [Flagelloscypha sp. PMI_526]
MSGDAGVEALKIAAGTVANMLAGFLLAFVGNEFTQKYTPHGILCRSRSTAEKARKILEQLEKDLANHDLRELNYRVVNLREQLLQVDELLNEGDAEVAGLGFMDARVKAWHPLSKKLKELLSQAEDVLNHATVSAKILGLLSPDVNAPLLSPRDDEESTIGLTQFRDFAQNNHGRVGGPSYLPLQPMRNGHRLNSHSQSPFGRLESEPGAVSPFSPQMLRQFSYSPVHVTESLSGYDGDGESSYGTVTSSPTFSTDSAIWATTPTGFSPDDQIQYVAVGPSASESPTENTEEA